MALVVRDFDTMVEAILDRIIATNVGFTDKGRGSVLRALVEAIVAEMDIQYYSMQRIYVSRCIDDAVGEDLDKIIAILRVIRNQPTKASGNIKLFRSTPATSDIPIPIGTVVTTRPDINGSVAEFVTTESATLLTGQSDIVTPIQASIGGFMLISIGQISIMPDPIVGIEGVINENTINGGIDLETDDQLRARSRLALDGLGKATDDALVSAVSDINGVLDAMILDQNRGVATSDIVVICSTMPPTQTVIDAVNLAVQKTKASGVDVGVIYPTTININVSVTVTGSINPDIVGNAIITYFETLKVGNTLIIAQMERTVLQSISDTTIDIATVLPATNQVPGVSELLRCGTVTINGVLWNG